MCMYRRPAFNLLSIFFYGFRKVLKQIDTRARTRHERPRERAPPVWSMSGRVAAITSLRAIINLALAPASALAPPWSV